MAAQGPTVVSTVDEDKAVVITLPGVYGGALSPAEDAILDVVIDMPMHGDLVLNADGTITYRPHANYNGPDSFTYRPNDGSPRGTVLSVDLTVHPVNDAPQPADDIVHNIVEDTPGVYVIPVAALLVNDKSGGGLDESGQILSVVGVISATGGTAVLSGTDILFTRTPDYAGPATVTFLVRDDGFSQGAPDYRISTSVLAFNITPINDTPVAVRDILDDILEDSTGFNIPPAMLLANDRPGGGADEARQILTLTSVSDAVGGVVSIRDGQITFTPALNFSGTASFTYTVVDDGNTDGKSDPKSTTGVVSFKIAARNDAPIARDDLLGGAYEDVAGGYVIDPFWLTANDSPGGGSDEFSQTLKVVGVARTTGGTAELVNGKIIFRPIANYSGPASVTYIVSDDGASNSAEDHQTATATATFMVYPQNDAPIAIDDYLPAIIEDYGPTRIGASLLTANDNAGGGALEAGQTLTVISVGRAVGGTVSLTDGVITFTPHPDYAGVASFEYMISDDGVSGYGSDYRTATAVARFQVLPKNDTPIGANETIAGVSEDISGGYRIRAAQLLANDRAGGGTDEAGQALNISGIYSTTGGTAQIVDGDIVFTPAANYSGPASVTYLIRDNGRSGDSDDFLTTTATASFHVSEVNDAPEVNDDHLDPITEDAGVRVITAAMLLGNDRPGGGEDGQTLTIVSVSNPIGGTVSITGNQITFYPTPDFTGAASFSYVVRDNGQTNGMLDAKTASGVVRFEISAINDAPIAFGETLANTTEDVIGGYVIPFSALTANDRPGGGADEAQQGLTVVEIVSTVGGTARIVGRDVIFTPTENYAGPASVTYVMSDDGHTKNLPDAKSATATAVFSITPVNDAPLGAGDHYVTAEEITLVVGGRGVVANDTDIENDVLGAILVESPRHGSLTFNADGTFTYTPASNYVGEDSFTYRASDNRLTSAPVTVNLTVTGMNDAPIFMNMPAQTMGVEQVFTLVAPEGAISDPELSALRAGAGDFAGSRLTVERVGGGEDDAFGLVGGVYVLSAGRVINTELNAAIATYTLSAGRLEIVFTGEGAPVRSAVVDSLLQAIAYRNLSDAPPAEVTLAWTFVDGDLGNQGAGGSHTITATSRVSIASINDAPTLIAMTDPLTFVEGSHPLPLIGGLTVSDVDSNRLMGAVVRITEGLTPGDRLTVDTGDTDIRANYDAASGTLTLSGEASLAIYQTLLQSVTFVSNSDAPTAMSDRRVITWQANDGRVTSVALRTTVTVAAVEDAPTITAPAALTAIADQPLRFADLAVSDPDGPGRLTVVLSVEQGILRVSASIENGLLFGDITGNGTNQVTLVGAEAAVNATLSGLGVTYRGGGAPDALKITVADASGLQAVRTVDLSVVTALSQIATEEGALDGYRNVVGLDAASNKSTPTTLTLANGQVIDNPLHQEASDLVGLAARYEAGALTRVALIDALTDFAADTKAVALQVYNFFTGSTPSEAGMTWLVDSPDNLNDLTDAYYAQFSEANRYINFAVNLGKMGEGAQGFARDYGALSFEAAIRKAYGEIIGEAAARAAGVSIDTAVAYVAGQKAYFLAVGGDDIGAKAAMVGYLMQAGMAGHVGVYYDATRAFFGDAFDGGELYGVDLVGVYGGAELMG